MLTNLLLTRLLAAMREHYQRVRSRMARDDGYASETVVITALLVILGADRRRDHHLQGPRPRERYGPGSRV